MGKKLPENLILYSPRPHSQKVSFWRFRERFRNLPKANFNKSARRFWCNLKNSEQVHRQSAKGPQLSAGQSQGHSLVVKRVGVPRLSYTRPVLVSQESACSCYCVNKASWFNTQLKNNNNKKKKKQKRMWALQSSKSGWEFSLCHLLTVCPWASYCISLVFIAIAIQWGSIISFLKIIWSCQLSYIFKLLGVVTDT